MGVLGGCAAAHQAEGEAGSSAYSAGQERVLMALSSFKRSQFQMSNVRKQFTSLSPQLLSLIWKITRAPSWLLELG